MTRDAALPPGVGATTGVALAVLGIAGAALALLAAGDAGGWLAHGPRPAQWSVVAWAALFLAGWTLMTGAMMLPSSLPFLQAVHRLGSSRASTAAGFGFSVAWLAVGALQWAALWTTGDLLTRVGPGRAEQLAGASLLLAAAYQASPLARACQRACAQPFAILARHWRGTGAQRRDAFAAGLRYGLNCIGCCVPMILLMFVVGIHDVGWCVALAILMAVQKHAAWGARIALPAAAALAVAGVGIAAQWWVVPLHSLRTLCGG